MSAIDELRNRGLTIDTTAGEDSATAETINESGGISIDTTDENTTNVVDLSGLANKKNNHRVVLPVDKSAEPRKTVRKAVDVSDISIDTTSNDEEDIHESFEKDLLDMNNPDSPFSKYLKRETEKALEFMAEREEEKAVMEAEAEEDDNLGEDVNPITSLVQDEFEDEYEDEEEVKYTTYDNLTDVDSEDISDLFDDKDTEVEEEENSMPDITIKNAAVDDIPTEEELDTEIAEEDIANNYEAVEDEDLDFANSQPDPEVEEVEEKKEEVNPVEPDQYDAPEGLDAEVSDDLQSFATEIVEEEESTVASNNTDDEILKHLQKLATEKLKPVSKSLDISSFTIVKKPITNVSPIFEAQKARVVKWVLYKQQSIVQMKEFSGSELEKLREYSEDNRSIDSLNRRFHLIYDHIVSPKPQSFEQWLKTTPYEDVDNYFFAVYVACFKGANYLPGDCPNPTCKETFLSDDIKIMDMVKFANKDAQMKFAEIYQSEPKVAGKGVYCTEVVPLSDKIAISFREPSIYNVFELAGLDDKTRTSYANILEYIPYIDTIYLIDQVNRTLTPVTYKMFPDNATRTTRSKIQKYDNIFNTLSVDEFGPIKAYVSAIADKTQDMYYVYPSLTCPKCGNTTEETRTTAESLVFTRYQLGSLVTTDLK